MRGSPTDRGITRNKEIANLLRAHPSFFLSCTRLPPHPLLPPPLILSEQGGGAEEVAPAGLRVISGFMGRDLPGSSGSVPDDGEKAVGPKI